MKLWLGLFVALLVIFGTATFLFQKRAQALASKIQTRRAESLFSQTVQTKISEARAQLAQLGPLDRVSPYRLISESEINQFFSFVNGLAGPHGVAHDFTFTSPPPTALPQASAGEVRLNLTLESESLAGIEGFLAALESGPYLLTVHTVALTAPGEGTKAKATVEFTLYVNKAS